MGRPPGCYVPGRMLRSVHSGVPIQARTGPHPLLSVSPKQLCTFYAGTASRPPGVSTPKAESRFSPQTGEWGEEKARGVAPTCQLCKASLQNQGLGSRGPSPPCSIPWPLEWPLSAGSHMHLPQLGHGPEDW